MKRSLLLLLALTLITTACGDNDTDDETTVDLDTEDPELLLEIEDEGGFVPIEFNLGRIPRYALFSNGILFYQGAVAEIYPGPLVPNVLGVQLDPADVADIQAEVDAIGLPDITEEINTEYAQNVADASTLVATYYDENGTHRYGVYGYGMFGPGGDGDPQVEALGNLVLLLDQIVSELPAEPEDPSRVQVYVGETQFIDDAVATIEPWAFDFDPAALTPEPFGFACLELDEPAATSAWFTFKSANQQTFWEKDGVTYTLIPVPLFYDQQGCV